MKLPEGHASHTIQFCVTQYQYDIKKTGDENKEKYQLED